MTQRLGALPRAFFFFQLVGKSVGKTMYVVTFATAPMASLKSDVLRAVGRRPTLD